MLLEILHDLQEVQERPAEPVQLVAGDDVHTACLHVLEDPLEGRAVCISAGVTAVVIPRRESSPSLTLLALDIRLHGLPLGLQAVEFLVQAFVGGDAAVDGDTLRYLGDG